MKQSSLRPSRQNVGINDAILKQLESGGVRDGKGTCELGIKQRFMQSLARIDPNKS